MKVVLVAVVVVLIALVLGVGPGAFVSSSRDEVIVYTALDSVFSREIFETFEAETGIRVRAVYDTEATKTAGLVDRLRREQKAPRADVFWNNEICRTIQLGREGLLESYVPTSAADIPSEYRDAGGLWTGFAARARVVAFDPKRVEPDDVPAQLDDLLRPEFKGRVAIADPEFGTTGTHLAALLTVWGEDRLRQFLEALVAQNVQLVAGNSSSRDRVLTGEALVGLTDTDDVEVVRRRGLSVDASLLPGEGTLVIPNTIAILRGAPHLDAAQRFVEWVLRPEIEERLAGSPSRQIPVRASVQVPESGLRLDTFKALRVDWNAVTDALPRALDIARRILPE